MTKSKKIALVPGANRGLGFETARELLEKNVDVILGCKDKNKGDEAVKELARRGLTRSINHFRRNEYC